MKHIGHVDGAVTPPLTWKTHSLGMMFATDLFIPSPGERENIDAMTFKHVGWIDPNADGGTVWANRADADKDTRPAYVLQHSTAEPVAQPSPVPAPPRVIQAVSTDDLVKEVLEFCSEELDRFDGPDFDSNAEVCCQRSNVYLRELIHRFVWSAPTSQPEQPAPAAPLGGLTGSQADVAEDAHRRIDALIRSFNVLAQRISDLKHTISQPATVEPAMTFYDHAFIAAWWSLANADYSDEVRAGRAHELASVILRYRQPRR